MSQDRATASPQASSADLETWSEVADLRATDAAGRRVLVVGCSPLPFEDATLNLAPGGRTWQLTRPLLEAGHAVCLACWRIPGTSPGAEDREIHRLERNGARIYTFSHADFHDPGGPLAALARAFAPDVVVGATALPSRRAADLAAELPLWVDLFGDPMAEAQAKASVEGRDIGDAYIELLFPLLRRGDAFSAVSETQRDAVIGQLGLAGRLNYATHGHDLVEVVPCAAERISGPEPATPDDLAPSDVVLLWSGGFNTWCDVETLVPALERAFAEAPNLRLVVTGGAIRGHDETTWARFQALIEPTAGRVLLKGALPTAELRRYQHRADLALITEKALYERRLGASARMAEWLALGLPFVSSDTSEIARAARDAGAAATYPVGDAAALAERLVELAADPARRRAMADAGRDYAARELTYAATTAPLVRWVARAERAADAAPGAPRLLVRRTVLDRERAALIEQAARLDAAHAETDTWRRRCEQERQLRQETLSRLDEQAREAEHWRGQYHEARGELGKIHGSRMWRWWMRYLAARGWLTRLLD